MGSITLDIDVSKNVIYLLGDIDSIKKNRFAWRYLRDYFQLEIGESKIIISIGENDTYSILSKIQALLNKYGFEEKPTNSTEKILLDFYEEERKFALFSNEALQIRNNNCNKSDFQEFTEKLAKYLPARTLYPLQLLSSFHMAFSQNSCNFSVPGSGKTSIVYGAYAYLKNLPDSDPKHVNRILIIGPLSSFGPWELEFEECFGRKPNSKRLTADLAKINRQDYLYSRYPAEITLISYASVVSLQQELDFFLRNNKVMVVLDEAHKIKNVSGGVTAQAVLNLAKNCKSRVVLTGTPAPNGYEDLYNMFKFIWPLKSIIGFEINQLRDISSRGDKNRVDRLIANISPFFIRIKKSDLNLPPATINPPIAVTMGPYQQSIYDFIEKKYLDEMMKDFPNNTESAFRSSLTQARTIRLMQAATNPAMLKNPLENFLSEDGYSQEIFSGIDDSDLLKSISSYEELETPAKYIAAKDLISNIISNNEKVIVWATFIHTILNFKDYLASFNIPSQTLYGAIPVDNDSTEESSDINIVTREKIVKDFHRPNCPYKVLIANPFAVAESISLHKACHNAIYLERSFNAAHFVQSKDRIHRYGLNPNIQTNYYYMISKNTIDETINTRLSEKEMRMIEIMETMPIPLFDNIEEELGDEDIKALIRDYVKRSKKS